MIFKILWSGLNHPESRTLYTETDQNLEKCLEILDFAFLQVTPILATWPALIVSFIKYFMTHFDDSAFELPFPMW